MRSHPINSPQAAARLLAMAMVADGHCSMSEIRALDRLDASRRLGLAPDAMKAVIDGFCEDLLRTSGGEWAGPALIDEPLRCQLLNEVQDPALGAELRRLCEAVMLADGHLAGGEIELMDALARTWPHPATTAAQQGMAPAAGQ